MSRGPVRVIATAVAVLFLTASSAVAQSQEPRSVVRPYVSTPTGDGLRACGAPDPPGFGVVCIGVRSGEGSVTVSLTDAVNPPPGPGAVLVALDHDFERIGTRRFCRSASMQLPEATASVAVWVTTGVNIPDGGLEICVPGYEGTVGVVEAVFS